MIKSRENKMVGGHIDIRAKNVLEFEILSSRKQKLKGLLGVKPDDKTRVLSNCKSVHTHGMKHEIDIAFLDKNGTILQVVRRAKPGHVFKNSHADAVAERFSKDDDWYSKGDYFNWKAAQLLKRNKN